jgi:hypothetical protein
MTHTIAVDQVLKVHRAGDGSVWYVAGDKDAVCSPLNLHDFPDGPEVSRFSHVHMLGTWDNAPLISRFYTFKRQRRIASIAVASQMLGRTRAERHNPRLMLARMRNFNWPASLGGYHEVTRFDFVAYLLATYFQFNLSTPGHIDQVLRDYALCRYLDFIPHLDRSQLARLVGMILDPRWFTRWDDDADEYNPRDYVLASKRDVARLNQFLGLSPETMPGGTGYTGYHAVAQGRAQVVLAAWKTTESPPRAALDDDPRYFLWKRWRAYGSAAEADLRVSQLFADFIRLGWLDCIYENSVTRGPIGRPDGLFVPEYFFQPSEASAFRVHMEARQPDRC